MTVANVVSTHSRVLRIRRILSTSLLAAAAVGCSAGVGDDVAADIENESSTAALTPANGGTPIAVASRTALELAVVWVKNPSGGYCTGTLVRPNWVLTAKHCVLSATGAAAARIIEHEKGSQYTRNVAAADVKIHPDPTVDAALLRLTTAINAGQLGTVPLFSGGDPNVVGSNVTTYGYGGVSTLHKGNFSVVKVSRDAMNGNPIYNGKYLQLSGLRDGGDSGGPTFLSGAIVGVTGSASHIAYAKSFRNWANGILSPATNNRIDSARPNWATNYGPAGSYVRTGDVNGDSYTDVIQFNMNNAPRGSVYVALGQASGFGPMSRWHTFFGVDSEIPHVADVDGDGKDDIVTFVQASGAVYIARSNGVNAFAASELWQTAFSYTGETPALGDVNGDGRADAVTFVHHQNWGAVWVSLSCGATANQLPPGCSAVNSFASTRTLWSNNFSLLNETARVGDVNGDGFADLATFSPGASGSAYVALSKRKACASNSDCPGSDCWTAVGYCAGSLGEGGGTRVTWRSGGIPSGSGQTLNLADMNGDGFLDVVDQESAAGSRNGYVGVALSNGSSAFGSYATWTTQAFCSVGDTCLVGDKNRDGRADLLRLIPGGSDSYALSLP